MKKNVDSGVAVSADLTQPKPVDGASHEVRTVDSQALLGSQGLLYIRHLGEIYRLQTTRFGKLILTK
jgi:hemin uptake protein HemP